MKRVFICSPFRGKSPIERERNVQIAKDLCRDAVRKGLAAFAPHLLYPSFLDEDFELDRAQGIEAGKAFLLACDEVQVFALNGISAGMKSEIEFAEANGIPVTYPWGPVPPVWP